MVNLFFGGDTQVLPKVRQRVRGKKIQQKVEKKRKIIKKVNKNKTNLPKKVNLTTYLVLKLCETFMKSGIVNIVNKILLRSFLEIA